MELSYFIVILFGLFGQGYQQTANEQNDPNLKKQVVMERSSSGSITFSCTFEIQDVSNKFVNGEFVVSWSKVQNSTDVILNNGPVLRYLPDGMKEHLSYNQKTENTNTLRTAITIKDPRPEESGQYRCELKWSSSTNGGHSSQLTYTLNVIDSDEFQVILYGNDNPMLVPRKPNITSWPSTKTIQLDEKPQDILKPQQYAYLACVASGPSVTAVVTVTLNSTENPERNRNLHGRMDSIIISEYVGPEIGAQKQMIWNLLEDRSFPVDSRDDGATVTCVGTVENEDNQEVLHKEVSAVLNLLTKPEFVNCSKEVYSPMGAKNFVISCMIKAKPILTGDVTWFVQPNNGDEFQVQQNYGYHTNVIAEGKNLYIAKLTIQEVTEQQHLRAVFRISVENSVGNSEFRILLLEGEDPNIKPAVDGSGHLVCFLLPLLSAVIAILMQWLAYW